MTDKRENVQCNGRTELGKSSVIEVLKETLNPLINDRVVFESESCL